MKTPEERFWSKVDRTGACWQWTGAKNIHGYGRLKFYGRFQGAHRVAYQLEIGTIPEGHHIDHTCHNKACVTPAHLRPATNKQNAENLAGPYSNSTSGIRGVTWIPRTSKWLAYVTHNGKKIDVGYFRDIKDAEAAVIAKRLELFTHNDADRRAS